MGNYRFRLSDMMPNAWFYKLRDMSKTRTQNPSQKRLPSPSQKPRKSLYQNTDSIRLDRLYTSPKNPKSFDTHFPYDPPRKSSKKRAKRRTIYMPSPRQIQPGDYTAFQDPGKVHFQDWDDDQDFLDSPLSLSGSFDAPLPGEGSWSSSGSCKLSSSATDIIIDVDLTSYATIKTERSAEFSLVSEPELPPILTKPKNRTSLENQNQPSPVKFPAETRIRSKKTTSPGGRKSVSRSGGVRIRGNGPKLAGKKGEIRGRKSVRSERKDMLSSQSFAIVKASFDPERDFKDSMLEMIVENNIRASKDLEDLLACYLSLNSNQYHDLIIKAFEQIWFNMPQPQF